MSDILVPLALFLQGVLALSPIWPLIGVRGTAIYGVVYLITMFEIACNNRKLPLSSVYLCVAVFFGSCLTAIYWQNVKIAFLPLFFVGSILIASIADRNAVNGFITALTYFLMAILVLSWIGFFYALLGGEGILTIKNPDGGANVLFLTTFSNYFNQNYIRASGIFDEPGTLSFLVCALAGLRQIYNRRNSVSVALLLLGIVTFSLTHAAFLAFFLFSTNRRSLKFKLGLCFAIAIAMVLAYFVFLKEAADSLFLNRFQFDTKMMTFYGDNRSQQVFLAFSKLTARSFLWGLDSTGITNVQAFWETFGSMQDNPLGPLVTSGIFVSFPYYYFLLRLFLKGMRSREHNIYLAVLLLFIPRPYVTSYGYSVFAMLFLLSLDPVVLYDRKR